MNNNCIIDKFVKRNFVIIWFGFQNKKQNICLTEVDYIITKYSLWSLSVIFENRIREIDDA